MPVSAPKKGDKRTVAGVKQTYNGSSWQPPATPVSSSGAYNGPPTVGINLPSYGSLPGGFKMDPINPNDYPASVGATGGGGATIKTPFGNINLADIVKKYGPSALGLIIKGVTTGDWGEAVKAGLMGAAGAATGMDPIMSALIGQFLQGSLSENKANREANTADIQQRMDLLKGGLRMGEDAYAAKAPLREQGQSKLLSYLSGPASWMFHPPGRPAAMGAPTGMPPAQPPTSFVQPPAGGQPPQIGSELLRKLGGKPPILSRLG